MILLIILLVIISLVGYLSITYSSKKNLEILKKASETYQLESEEIIQAFEQNELVELNIAIKKLELRIQKENEKKELSGIEAIQFNKFLLTKLLPEYTDQHKRGNLPLRDIIMFYPSNLKKGSHLFSSNLLEIYSSKSPSEVQNVSRFEKPNYHPGPEKEEIHLS